MGLAGSVDLVLLDLDGTLIDRDAAFETACARFIDTHDLGLDATRWLMLMDGGGYAPRSDVADALFDRFPHLVGCSGCVETLLQGGGAEFVTLDDQVRNALIAQRMRGRALVVVTNGPTAQQEEKLARSGLTELVDAWAISESLGLRKPDPEMFRVAAAMVGMAAQGAWMIGDSATADVGGGAAAGCRTVWISRGRPWPGLQPEPSFVAADLVAGLAAIG